MSEQIEGRNAVLEAFRSGNVWTSFLFWTDARMDQYAPLSVRQEKKIQSLILYRKSVWIS
mgnify:CR=1 FL=1